MTDDNDTEFEQEWVLHNWVKRPTIVERQPFMYLIRIDERTGLPVDLLNRLDEDDNEPHTI